jgi:hypothetical protein
LSTILPTTTTQAIPLVHVTVIVNNITNHNNTNNFSGKTVNSKTKQQNTLNKRKFHLSQNEWNNIWNTCKKQNINRLFILFIKIYNRFKQFTTIQYIYITGYRAVLNILLNKNVWTFNQTLCLYVSLSNTQKHCTLLCQMYRGRRGRDRIVVGFITTYSISAYHH